MTAKNIRIPALVLTITALVLSACASPESLQGRLKAKPAAKISTTTQPSKQKVLKAKSGEIIGGTLSGNTISTSGMASSAACATTPDDAAPVKRTGPLCTLTNSTSKRLTVFNDLARVTDSGGNVHENQIVRMVQYNDMLATFNSLLTNHYGGNYSLLTATQRGSLMRDLLNSGTDLMSASDYVCGVVPPAVGPDAQQGFTIAGPTSYDLAFVYGAWDYDAFSGTYNPCYSRNHYGVYTCGGGVAEKIRFLRMGGHQTNKNLTVKLSRFFPNSSFTESGWTCG